MSEAELHIIGACLPGGMLNKASRGQINCLFTVTKQVFLADYE